MIKRVLKDIKDLALVAPDCIITDNTVIVVDLPGPKDSQYAKGVWKIRIEIPKEYPYKSPSVGFVTKIYHPNVDFNSGSICINVLNETWTPIYNLCHIFNTFLPQLLLYPNPEDPLNIDAAKLYTSSLENFSVKVSNYIDIYC